MDEYLNSAVVYLQTNPLVAGAIGLVLLYLLFRETKLLLYLLLLAAALGVSFFLIETLASRGGASKSRMINQTGTQDVK
jgi:hypothetical protein